MPRTVDHEQRRAQLTEVTAHEIVRVGLEGVRLRDVARAAGWTTGAVSHYFPDKRTLLLATFRSRTELAELALPGDSHGRGHPRRQAGHASCRSTPSRR